MIEANTTKSGIAISIKGRSDELVDEASVVVESIVCDQFENVKKKYDNERAVLNAKQMFAAILAMSAERIKHNTGVNVLDLDIYEEVSYSEPFGNPFTMGMSGEAFADFLMGMKGE